MPLDIVENFLESIDVPSLPWNAPSNKAADLIPHHVLIGRGGDGLEVAIASCLSGPPPAEAVRRLQRHRHDSRPAPVLLAVLYRDGETVKASTCGVSDPLTNVDVDRLARACSEAFREPDGHFARRALERMLPALADPDDIAGLHNIGLFATHELRTGVPYRSDWTSASATAKPLLGLRGLSLIHGLGYGTSAESSAAMLLTERGSSRAVAVLLDDEEVFDRPAPRFDAVSPVSYAIAVGTRLGLPWVIVVRGSRIRLHPVAPAVGVGRQSQGETYFELDLALLREDAAGYLQLIFSPAALGPGGTVHDILRSSSQFAANLGGRLRERVYHDVVPGLAVAVARRMQAATDGELQEAYQHSLVILFRLLFTAYAEDRGLLPYGRNEHYTRHAAKTLARNFTAEPGQTFDPSATALWDDMAAVWNAIDCGNQGWNVPAYNGGLFSSDGHTNPSGAALASLRLSDAEFGPALRALLVDVGPDGTRGPVDFRSLSVREFGTCYEGLLESSLSIAPGPLKIDKEGSFIPAIGGDQAAVHSGDIYFHNRSGKRKSTGSYFTKSFAVEHLLDTALEPALSTHLDRVRALLNSGDNAEAANAFFDFRMADLAMGSGHFLIAAIDRIESRFTTFLTEHPIAAVHDELSRLSAAARAQLYDHADEVEIETSALLRRQIARRCVYGLDLNPMAVELARLAVWIHTFVPGLPMSSLDHGLVVGNSLTGIGTIEEVVEVLDPKSATMGAVSLFEEPIKEALGTARERLARVALTAEATKQEVTEARIAHEQALEDASDARALFDAAVAMRLGLIKPLVTPEQAVAAGHTPGVHDRLDELGVTHFPLRFPEVFLRERPGFDVLLGNPPWEKVKVEEHQWWGLRFPGLRSMSQQERRTALARHRAERPDLVAEYEAEIKAVQVVKQALSVGPFPGLRAATDTDLSLAFAWRFWHLLREGGRLGVVLPRTVLNGTAGAKFRRIVLAEGAFADVTMLVNNRHWVFEEVHPQYMIGLATLVKGVGHSGSLELHGPFFSRLEFDEGAQLSGHVVDADTFVSWSDGASFPVLPRKDSMELFLKLRSHPRLDSSEDASEFVPLRELHSTADKALFDLKQSERTGDVPVLTVGSFNLWRPDYGSPYAYANSSKVIPFLHSKRKRQIRLPTSAMYGMPEKWALDPATLPCLHPRIVFRDTARGIDSRTIIAALIPGGTTMVHSAPYLLRRRGTAADEAYLLGVLCSVVLDWYARRYVELHVTAGIMSALPIPQPTGDSPIRRRAIILSGRLAAVDSRYAEWAEEVGVPVGSVNSETERQDLIAELDALVALLYGLDRGEVIHVFATFHRGWDHSERLTAVLRHFEAWKANVA
ncbi:hypothetical protein SAMN05421505_1543 [Sinosporangium album]|uniref:site-specific DNA-methyltransferase (adenine-specific) n=1 Tax=Sinosporangium album TaxID=504805 RepID=A0A1G8KRN5_9ACTN|nr:hypothetical protein [Sinosporangium album]SDI46033.1 hypothetical protein SAMN05421505_1543 [Sinosporangium album]